MSVRQGNNIIAGVAKENLTGFVAAFAGSTAPSGWLVCDGSAISRNDYADLFATIGTTYGSGDGSTTFNLPDLSGKLPLYDSGATLGSTTNGSLPNLKGDTGMASWNSSLNGLFYNAGTRRLGYESANATSVSMNANKYNSIYNDSATGVTPAGVYTLWCIKY